MRALPLCIIRSVAVFVLSSLSGLPHTGMLSQAQDVPIATPMPEGKPALPSFADLEAAGAVIGEIRIDNQNIFDLANPKENNFLFRAANTLHIRTRVATIRRSLLFHTGEKLQVRLIDETDRLLRTNDYIQDVRIQPVDWHDGVVDILVTTRDTWTLQPSVQFSRQGGSNTSGVSLSEHNFLGTGISLGVKHSSDADRKGLEYSISSDHEFGGWTVVAFTRGLFDDGSSVRAKIDKPFYALDTRWAAGASMETNDQVTSLYDGGRIVGQYRHKFEDDEIYAGISKGLVNGWARRYSLGLKYKNDTYRTDPSLVQPILLPTNQQLVAPFVRLQWVEDDFERLKNRDQIERVEYLPLGFNATLEIQHAHTALGSSRDLWLYLAKLADGYTVGRHHHLLLSAHAEGQYSGLSGEHQALGAALKYYRPQLGRGLFFSSIAFDAVTSGDSSDQLLLGGDNGLRGYPLRYQSGDRRALLSIEQRGYTDWYPFRLFRVGGAAFVDVGRAWAGASQNTANPGWLSDIGIGLRILNARAAFGNVLHIDFAVPLNREPGIPSYQFLVKSRATF